MSDEEFAIAADRWATDPKFNRVVQGLWEVLRLAECPAHDARQAAEYVLDMWERDAQRRGIKQ